MPDQLSNTEHNLIDISGSSYRSKSSGNSYRETSGSLSSGSYSSKPKSANKPTYNSYDSYDDGYDDVYMDGDYDYDRYDRDSDYADGVDDAMDELGEDGFKRSTIYCKEIYLQKEEMYYCSENMLKYIIP